MCTLHRGDIADHPVQHISPTSGIASPTGEQTTIAIRMTGPAALAPGDTATLSVEFVAQNYDGAVPPNEFESVWLPLSIETVELILDFEETLQEIDGNRPLSDEEMWDYYRFENVYDVFEVPDYRGVGSAQGEHSVKRYDIPLQFAALETMSIM